MSEAEHEDIDIACIPVPLPNLGNTCFMNAALQLLWAVLPRIVEQTMLIDDETFATSTERPLYGEILNLFRKRTAKTTRERRSQKQGATMSEIERSLLLIREAVSLRYSHFKNDGEQADSHEFLRCLLDILHRELNQGLGDAVQAKNLQGKLKKESDTAAEERWKQWRLARDRSACEELFQGTQRTVVRCLRCSQRSYNFDPVGGVHVELSCHPGASKPAKKREHAAVVFLQQELKDRMLTPEVCTVDGYLCDTCNEGSRSKVVSSVEKTTTVTRVPECLIVHLKRFLPYGKSKNMARLDFPQSLELGEKSYTIVGVCSHVGNDLNSGHYLAAVETDSGIFLCDDDTITEIDNCRRIDGEPYVLLYRTTEA